MARTNRTRLSVESLEDRAVPATHTWTGPSGGLWSVAANWNGGVPASGESGGTRVVINTDVATTMDVAGLTLDALAFENTGSSTLALNTPLTLVSGAATLTQGAGSTTITGSSITLTPGQATFSVNGPFATLTINSAISGGATTLVKDGEFPLILGGNNTLAASSFKLGTVVVTHSNALGAGSVQFDGGGRLNTAGGADITVANPIRVQQLPPFSEVAIGSQAGGTGKTSFTGNVLIDVDGASLLLEASSSKGTFFFGNIAVASGKKADVVVGSGATDQQVVLSNSTGTPNDFGGGKVTVGGGAQLRVFGGADLNLPDNSNVHFGNAASTLELDAADETIGVLVSDAPGAGVVKGSTGNRTLTLGGNNNTGVFSGQLIDGTAGTLSLTVFTTNAAPDPLTSQTLGGNSTFTGPTSVNGGDLIVNGNNGPSAVAVSFDGLLGGSGSVGTVTAGAFGFVRPGGKTTPGTLSTQNVELQDLSAFEVLVNGPAAGQFGLLNVTGTVKIFQDADLFVPGTAQNPSGFLAGQTIVVINNDGTDPIDGRFKGIPSGGMVTADDGHQYIVNYFGGDGNDLTLTGRPVGKFQFSAAASTVDEGTETGVTVTVTRTDGTDGPVTLLLSAPGTAQDGSDFALPFPASVTFANGQTSQTVTVLMSEDALDENDESFALTLNFPDGGGTLGTRVTHTVTITDNDNAPSVSIGSAAANEGDSGTTTLTFVATLDAPSGKEVKVNFATAPGTALAGTDYTAASGTLTFAPGETQKTVTVQVIGDTPFELTETFTVVLSGPTNATVGSGPGTGTITNDDKASSTTTLTVDPNPAVPDQPVTFTATVAAVAPATGTPTGLVVFRLGDVELGTGTLVNGVVTFTTATLLPGTYEIDAAFVGNDTTTGSDSEFVNVTVNRANSTTTLTASPNPSVSGQGVTFTAAVAAVAPGTGTPTGNVDFFEGSTLLGTVALVNGVATFTTSALRAGSHSIDALYEGDDTRDASNSAIIAVTVDLGTAAVALNLPTTARAGTTVTFTPTVTAVAPATATPVGRLMISFIDGGVIRGIEVPTGGTFTLPALGVGTHTVTVQFAPDNSSDFAAAQAEATITITAVASAAVLPSGLLVTGPADGKGLQFAPTNGRYTTGQQRTDLLPSGVEVRVAQGDVNGDGVMDLIVGSGPGGGPLVRVFDGQNPSNLLASFVPLDPTHRGGLFVAAGDLNGDGKAEIVVTPDAPDAFSGTRADGLHVQVFDGAKVTGGVSQNIILADFDGLASLSGQAGQNNPLVRLGGRAAVADVNGDGVPDLLVAAGTGGGPRITIWNGTGFAGANGGRPTANPIANLFVFENTQRGGAFVTSGDVNGDGKAEVIVGGGPGGGPRVRIVNAAILLALPNLEGVDLDDPVNLSNGLVLNNFLAGSGDSRGGVRPTVVDVDADGLADVVTGSGTGERSQVRVYSATSLAAVFKSNQEPAGPDVLDPFGATIPTGVWVG